MKDIFVHKNGEKDGPYTLEEVQSMVTSSQVTPETLAWRDGMLQWAPISAMILEDTSLSSPGEDEMPEDPRKA